MQVAPSNFPVQAPPDSRVEQPGEVDTDFAYLFEDPLSPVDARNERVVQARVVRGRQSFEFFESEEDYSHLFDDPQPVVVSKEWFEESKRFTREGALELESWGDDD